MLTPVMIELGRVFVLENKYLFRVEIDRLCSGEGIARLMKLIPKYKFWLETENGYVFGEGTFELLQGIREKGSLTASSRDLHMSYRHAWGIIKQMEENLGQAVLVTYKGGKHGGGGAKLTSIGKKLLTTYLKFKNALNQTISDFGSNIDS
jgi:molybdate transport repressor ModE-like protein